jgi:hypothetical protein
MEGIGLTDGKVWVVSGEEYGEEHGNELPKFDWQNNI